MSASTSATAACRRPGCTGHYGPEGYCSECGLKAAASATGGVGNAAVPQEPAPAAPEPRPGAGCVRSGCSGRYGPEGYCDECGRAAAAATHGARAPAQGTAADGGTSAASTPATMAGGLSTRTGAGLGGTPSGLGGRSSRSRGSARGRLGAGLVDVPPVPLRDPAEAVMSDPQVAESRRYCAKCNEPVGRGRDGQPGRTQGFCPHCGTTFSFRPSLSAGDVVDDRYEVLGCLAYGGLGWIYLARDRHVSDGGADRWVVLKGLINTADPDAMESAVAERRYLVEVDHPNIVKIHDFARHPDPRTGELVGYIVMEYVGGRSLKELALAHRDAEGRRAPLPLPQVLAYGLEVLPALGHLHDRGMVFCDFKPDNVIQSEEQLKLIDLGAVRRIDDLTGALFGTPGYQAPDVSRRGPSVGSDLYTVGRTLAVLSFPFSGFSSRYADTLPAPSDVELFAREPSYHRLLVRATHPDPAYRFESATAMADQVLGVLREVLSGADGMPRPSVSTVFTPERHAFGTAAGEVPTREDDGLDSRALATLLPLPLLDPSDPAASFLATQTTSDVSENLAALRGAPVYSLEVALRLVRSLLQLGEVRAADAELGRWDTGGDDWHDWRFDWHRGLRALTSGAPAEALTAFTAVACALPGEPAAQLAEAAAAELAGATQRAQTRYERVWRVDHGFVSAAFGLARLRLARGDRTGAVDVLDEVPDSSSRYVPAQIAAVRARLDARPGTPAEPDLLDAARRVERLALDSGRHSHLSLEVFEAALGWLTGGTRRVVPRGGLPPVVRQGGDRILGRPLTERGVRLGMESACRALAALERDALARYALVDRANAVRPRTLM